ncbi:HAD family hydrolase [Bacillus sp. IITD106]|nr:HAD family hydrolase [Bacillus sp. IITD106]
MIKGIIFDFDGLIFDTETHQYLVYQEIFNEYGSELPISLWQKEIGTQTGFSPFHYLEGKIKRPINHENVQKDFRSRFYQILEQEKAREGVEEYLKEAKKLNLKIGLASSSTYQWVSSHLKNLGLFNYFDCIKTSDDVTHVKPAPSLYLLAAKCLGLTIEECLVFEDSANGALAAKRAGMYCVVVPNKVTSTMNFCNVEYIMNSMVDLPLNKVIDLVIKKKAVAQR